MACCAGVYTSALRSRLIKVNLLAHVSSSAHTSSINRLTIAQYTDLSGLYTVRRDKLDESNIGIILYSAVKRYPDPVIFLIVRVVTHTINYVRLRAIM